MRIVTRPPAIHLLPEETRDSLFARRTIAGDFNGDRRGDVFFYAPATAVDTIWWGGGSRTFSSTTQTVDNQSLPLVGDFDGNGIGPATNADAIWYASAAGFSAVATEVIGLYQPVVGRFDGTNILRKSAFGNDFFYFISNDS